MKQTKRKIVPRGSQVLVVQDGEETRQSEYGILTPDNVEQERKAVGTVIAVGPKIEDVKEGDRVIFGAFAGEKIQMQEGSKKVDYVLLFDEDVLAFIKE